jgi:hypothetical protein
MFVLMMSLAPALGRRGFCTEYHCEPIEQGGSSRPVCVEQYTDDKIIVQDCPPGYFCDFDGWSAPQRVEGKRAYCKQNPDFDFAGQLAPGDLCQWDEQCYGSGTCSEGGVCEAEAGKVGDSCSGVTGEYQLSDKLCDPGNYCNTKIRKCVKAGQEGEPCEDPYSCQFGYGCYHDPLTGEKFCK